MSDGLASGVFTCEEKCEIGAIVTRIGNDGLLGDHFVGQFVADTSGDTLRWPGHLSNGN